MSFKPLKTKVLVKRNEEETQTKSGIILGPTKEKPLQGEVIATGVDVKEVKPGDQVLYGKYDGTETTLDGVPHLIMEESSILGIISI